MLRSFHLYQYLLITPLLCAQYTATVKTSVTEVESPGWKKWSDKECAINYPSNWTNEGSLGTSALATFFAPPDASAGFRERVLLASRDAAGASLGDLAKAMENEARSGLTDPTVVGTNATEETVTVELLGTMDGQPVRVKQETSLGNNKAWALTYIAMPHRFDDQLILADAMFLSFALK